MRPAAQPSPSASTLALAVVCLGLLPIGVARAQQFQEQTSTRFPSVPAEYTNQLSIADVDNDGDLDIAWANGGNFSTQGPAQPARLFINDGEGFFTDGTADRMDGVTGNFRGVEFGDIDDDGDLDMALANDFNQLPKLLVNDGVGFFEDKTSDLLPNITLGSSRVQFGDIDNDGDLDLYFTSGGSSRFGCGQNRIYVNDGTGFFTDETNDRHPLGNVCEPQDCIFGDIDGDFDLDIRTGSTASNHSKLYQNDGAGVFSDISSQAPADANCYSYDFGDIEGDGDIDLFGANANASGNNSDMLMRNGGTGVFTDASGLIVPNPNVDDNDSKFFDYDNDNDLDLIVARLGGSAERIYNNNSFGLFTEITGLITSVSDSTLDIMVADLTGDGKLDIVTAQGESGNFLNRIYINTTGPADSKKPKVVSTEQIPDTDDHAGPYVARAIVTDNMTSDRNFFYQSMQIKYRLDGGEIQLVDMRYSGGQVYRAELPGIPCGGTVEYWVYCVDLAGNFRNGAHKTFEISPVVGDMDCDGDADLDDLPLFVNVLVGLDADPAHIARADLNQDGLADADDVQSFVDLLN